MAGIDWKKAFELNEVKQWSVDDKSSWEKEQKIEAIIEHLQALDSTEEGKLIVTNLKLKYWVDIPFAELVNNIIPFKNKSEVSQRFYFFEGQPGISVDEAYRYLQNKWIEKSIQMKRKQTEEKHADDQENSEKRKSGSGLLNKKRIGNHNAAKAKQSKINNV